MVLVGECHPCLVDHGVPFLNPELHISCKMQMIWKRKNASEIRSSAGGASMFSLNNDRTASLWTCQDGDHWRNAEVLCARPQHMDTDNVYQYIIMVYHGKSTPNQILQTGSINPILMCGPGKWLVEKGFLRTLVQ